MKQYSLKCHCGRSEPHGFAPPATNLQTCVTARQIRAGCRATGCCFEVVEENVEFTDIDRLRLELVPSVVRPVLISDGLPYCEYVIGA